MEPILASSNGRTILTAVATLPNHAPVLNIVSLVPILCLTSPPYDTGATIKK